MFSLTHHTAHVVCVFISTIHFFSCDFYFCTRFIFNTIFDMIFWRSTPDYFTWIIYRRMWFFSSHINQLHYSYSHDSLLHMIRPFPRDSFDDYFHMILLTRFILFPNVILLTRLNHFHVILLTWFVHIHMILLASILHFPVSFVWHDSFIFTCNSFAVNNSFSRHLFDTIRSFSWGILLTRLFSRDSCDTIDS